MTDEERTDELTQKAKESYKIYSEDNCVDTYEGYQYIDGYCNGYEQGYEDCRHYAHDYYISEIKKLETENKDLQTRYHIVPEYYLSEAIDRCNELEAQIEKMKNFVKSMYEANENDAYYREYLGTILNEWDIEK